MQRGLPQAGDVVAGKYVIVRLLGRGGMGAVYVVEHRITGKKLALKCLLPEHLERPEFVERFLREAQAAGRIHHRNVVDVFDVGQEGELIYIVMELLDGKPLSELMHGGQLSLEETISILLHAMDGVIAAHDVGIVHRDLKPDNILVCVGQSDRLDDPRVLDFGISKLEDDIGKPLTKSGVMLGTPYYMSFEQINSQRDLDQRVDVYAMGVILYEAMSGQLPYVAESVGALAIRMMSGPPAALSSLRPELPTGLADVVMRSVARNRDDRYATMRELREALKPYCSDSAAMLQPPGQGTPLGSAVRHSRGIDATMPALDRSSSASPHLVTPTENSSARLKLDLAEHHSGRIESASSSKTLLYIIAAAVVFVLSGTGLLLALHSSEETSESIPPALPAPRVEAPARVEVPTPPQAPPEVAAPSEAAPVDATPVTALEAAPVAAHAHGKHKGRTPRGAAEPAQPTEDYVPSGTPPVEAAPAVVAPREQSADKPVEAAPVEAKPEPAAESSADAPKDEPAQ